MSSYIRGVNLWCLTAPLAAPLEVSFPDPNIAQRALYKVPLHNLPALSHPHFLGFSLLF